MCVYSDLSLTMFNSVYLYVRVHKIALDCDPEDTFLRVSSIEWHRT